MVKDIVGRVFGKTTALGTCFIVSKEYVFTARHVLEEKNTKTILKEVFCKFEYKNQSSVGTLIYEDKENDFAILKMYTNIESNFYRISREVIEKEDQWESSGYTASGITKFNFFGRVVAKNDINRYETYIHNQEDNGEWSGVSGAPIIIEDEIAGIAVEEESGNNLKTRLEIVSMESIIDKIKVSKPEIFDSIEIGYHPLLVERLDSLSSACEEIFKIYTEINDKKIVKYHVFIESDYSVEHLTDIVRYFIRDYGVELLLQEQCGKAKKMKRREIEDKIDSKKQHIIDLIKNQSQLIHILLWILVEGELQYPRIGSYIVDRANRIPRDIYISNESENINIIIGNGYLDKSIIDLFDNCINEIDEHLEKNSNKKYIIIKDKLAIESLNYSIQDKINTNIFKNTDESEISISVAILIGFNYEDIFEDELSNDEKIEYLKNYVSEYEEQFYEIIRKSKWINNTCINWFFIPYKDVNKFAQDFKNKIYRG